MSEYDVQKSIEAQAKYCRDKGLPHFAPKNGICHRCGKQIYLPALVRLGYGQRGYTTETAGRIHVTGCPHCNKSYCD